MKITFLAIIAVILSVITSDAQTIKPKSIYAKQMTFEIGGDILFTSAQYKREDGLGSSNDYTEQDFIFNVSAGIFVVNGLKLAVEPAIEIRSFESSTWTNVKLYFSPEYVFNLKTVVYPYIAGSVGYTSAASSGSIGSSETQSGFSWGAKGGLKYNAFGNALINIGFSYYRETYNYSTTYGDVKQHYNILGARVGISIFFR